MVELAIYVIMSVILGLLTEAIAYTQDFWTYRNRKWLLTNILVVFGLLFGTLSYLLREEMIIIQFASGVLFGILYEWANFALLEAWEFHNNKLLFLRGRAALILGVGLLWGLIVPINSIIHDFI